MLKLTKNADEAMGLFNAKPILVFRITGVPTVFTAASIKRFVKIGDPGLVIGNDWRIGDFTLLETAAPYVSYNMGGNTSTKIQQQLAPDRSQVTSNTSMVVSLLDRNQEITKLISPGKELTDVLYAEAKIQLGFDDTSYPEDFTTVFRGFIQEVSSSPGMIDFVLTSVEDKKRQNKFKIESQKLFTAVDASESSPNLQVTKGGTWPEPIVGPAGTIDTALGGDPAILANRSLVHGVRIGDEYFSYALVGSANPSYDLLTATDRTFLDFVEFQSAHGTGDDVNLVYKLQGLPLEIALKLMLSGWEGPFAEAIPFTNFETIGPGETVLNALFFEGVNVEDEYGLTPGDYIETTGSANPGTNDVSAKRISEVVVTETGSYIIVHDVNFVTEDDTEATVSFRSQYDVFTARIGLKMKPSQVDVKEFKRLNDLQFGQLQWAGIWYVSTEIDNMKTWMDLNIFLPIGCFSIPKQGRASVAFHIGPINGLEVVELNLSNVLNAEKLRIKRSVATNFYNQVSYRSDYDPREGNYQTETVVESVESKTRIPEVGDKTLTIEGLGVIDPDTPEEISTTLLRRYQFGAEYINDVKVNLKAGGKLEIGDIVLVDFAELKLSDSESGTRFGNVRYMEVINKTFDMKSGEITLNLVSTSFSGQDRFGVWAPSSFIDGSLSNTTEIFLNKSSSTLDYQRESFKWRDFIGQRVRIHSEDYSYDHERVLLDVDDSASKPFLVLKTALPSAPLEGYIVEPPEYPNDDYGGNLNRARNDQAKWKGPFVFWSPVYSIQSGTNEKRFALSSSDFAEISGRLLNTSGQTLVRIYNEDFSNDSGEVAVVRIFPDTYEVELEREVGFSISSDEVMELLNKAFIDEGNSYRWV